MQRLDVTLSRFYQGWDQYQATLVGAVAPLTPDQLARQAAPHLRPVWLIAAHVIGTRVGWFQNVMGEGDPALAAFDPWDLDGAPPRTAPELVDGLEATRRMIQECLDRWTPADRDDPITTPRGTVFTRQWIIWHVIEHDLHHGGELCPTLGAHGLPTPDL